MDFSFKTIEDLFETTITSIYSIFKSGVTSLANGLKGAWALRRNFKKYPGRQVGPYSTLATAFALPTAAFLILLDANVVKTDPNRMIDSYLGDTRFAFVAAMFVPAIIFDGMARIILRTRRKKNQIRRKEIESTLHTRQLVYYAISPYIFIALIIQYGVTIFSGATFLFDSIIWLGWLMLISASFFIAALNIMHKRSLTRRTPDDILWPACNPSFWSRVLLGACVAFCTWAAPFTYFKVWQIFAFRALEIPSLSCRYDGDKVKVQASLKNNSSEDRYIEHEVGNLRFYVGRGDSSSVDAMQRIDFTISKPETVGYLRVESGKTIDLNGEAAISQEVRGKYPPLGPARCGIWIGAESGKASRLAHIADAKYH